MKAQTVSPVWLAAPVSGAQAGFLYRAGGHSLGAAAGLNLGLHVGDNPVHVQRNRAEVERDLGLPVVFMNQVHGDKVAVVGESDALTQPGVLHFDTCDALVTTRTDIALAVMVADCVPALFVSEAAGVIAAAHVGRPGMMQGMGAKVIRQMSELGADPSEIRVALGPSACGDCYEVPQAMAGAAETLFPGSGSRTRKGTPSIDIVAGLTVDLVAAGLNPDRISRPVACTIEDEAFYSYRRDHTTGRFAGVIALK